jgi:hypothetical protein
MLTRKPAEKPGGIWIVLEFGREIRGFMNRVPSLNENSAQSELGWLTLKTLSGPLDDELGFDTGIFWDGESFLEAVMSVKNKRLDNVFAVAVEVP